MEGALLFLGVVLSMLTAHFVFAICFASLLFQFAWSGHPYVLIGQFGLVMALDWMVTISIGVSEQWAMFLVRTVFLFVALLGTYFGARRAQKNASVV